MEDIRVEQESISYLEQYVQVTEKMIWKIWAHARRYGIRPTICAYYENWADFVSEWCDTLGYTRTQARKLLHGGRGEFMFLPGHGIIRFVI